MKTQYDSLLVSLDPPANHRHYIDKSTAATDYYNFWEHKMAFSEDRDSEPPLPAKVSIR